MSNSEATAFVPILTVLPEYGCAWLWVVREPGEKGVGGNLCDCMGLSDESLMSEGLLHKFTDWCTAFEAAARAAQYYAPDFADDWDWPAFHERGLQLSRWLKEEVGDAYRVVYLKVDEDPNRRIEERTEILACGTLTPMPPFRDANTYPTRICQHIVSGGQTGADRAALDFAIEHGGTYTHGGWAPHDRQSEDGAIPRKYQLSPLAQGGYRQRSKRNVDDSDGTLIANLGDLDGGTLATRDYALKQGKPHLVVKLDAGVTIAAVESVLTWLRENAIATLNVAGPRESKRPGIHRATLELLNAVDKAIRVAGD